MRFFVLLFICLFCSCGELYLAGSYLFIIENKSPYDVALTLNHNYPDDTNLKPELAGYYLNPILKPGECVYYSKNVLSSEYISDLYKDNVTPIWDLYYIKEIRVNDTILDESKWRHDSCWVKEQNETIYYQIKYRLTIL